MKRPTILILLLLLPAVLAITQIQDPITNQQPTIEAEFNELVRIDAYELRSPTHYPSQTFRVTQETGNPARIFTFKVQDRLNPGDYEFFVKATNGAGRTINEYILFTIAGQPRPAFDVWVEEPPLGVALTAPYNVIITTTTAADCRYTTGPDPAEIYTTLPPPELYNLYLEAFQETGTQSQRHTLQQVSFNQWIPVACRDGEGAYHFDKVFLGHDNTPPTLQAYAAPNPVTDPALPSTTLIATTDDPSICFVGDQRFADSTPDFAQDEFELYTTRHEERITYAFEDLQPDPYSPKYRQYPIHCENLAGLASETATIEVLINLTRTLTIRKLAPGDYTNQASVNLTVETSVSGTCTVTAIDDRDTSQTMISGDGKIFTTYLTGLSEGSHSTEVTCIGLAGEVTQTFAFTIDRTGPSAPQVTAFPGCKEDRIEAHFKANDSTSGIAAYNYTITKAGQTIKDWTLTSQDRITHTTPTNPGEAYTWTVIAIDGAGNTGGRGTAGAAIYNSSSPICDENPPRIDLTYNETESGGEIHVTCQDAESGCKDSYWFGVAAPSGTCSFNDTQGLSRPIRIYQTSKVCARVSDYGDNNASSTEIFTVGQADDRPPHCINGQADGDETDVDCGGSCLACSDRASCETDSDCQSNYCNPQSLLCDTPSCTDTLSNGQETDTDCGGPECPSCPDGSACQQNFDCQSLTCNNRICQAPSCTDLSKNGDETDVDCGGSCLPCGIGSACRSDSDCQSGLCDEYGYCNDPTSTDSDGDGLPDEWEIRNGLDPSDPSDASQDPDEDGLSNYDEHQYNTDPNNPDSDGDGYTDGEEIAAGTDPNRPDSHPESNLLGLILLITGSLLSLGSAGYLVYARTVLPPPAHEHTETEPFLHMQTEERVFTPGHDPLAEAARQRLEEKMARQSRLQKTIKRHSLFDQFQEEGEGKSKIAIAPLQTSGADVAAKDAPETLHEDTAPQETIETPKNASKSTQAHDTAKTPKGTASPAKEAGKQSTIPATSQAEKSTPRQQTKKQPAKTKKKITKSASHSKKETSKKEPETDEDGFKELEALIKEHT
ncbi:MAG: hypothetical protein HC945_00585 [Nitrosarchaeum sp.]|nr:hypothetical protein [Nitrosarchaeum sp.]